jgi:hypothetical protein
VTALAQTPIEIGVTRFELATSWSQKRRIDRHSERLFGVFSVDYWILRRAPNRINPYRTDPEILGRFAHSEFVKRKIPSMLRYRFAPKLPTVSRLSSYGTSASRLDRLHLGRGCRVCGDVLRGS